eukprot:3849482-Rhodomonas_salina.2
MSIAVAKAGSPSASTLSQTPTATSASARPRTLITPNHPRCRHSLKTAISSRFRCARARLYIGCRGGRRLTAKQGGEEGGDSEGEDRPGARGRGGGCGKLWRP